MALRLHCTPFNSDSFRKLSQEILLANLLDNLIIVINMVLNMINISIIAYDVLRKFGNQWLEVLLAHSKSTTHCEPITVILAEIEAPELAAILGFVYTGSATVPRPRLDAFIRAAEALHIRLPSVPVVMTCSETNCKLEDVKDVKISTKYLQCDQYPSCNRWYRSGRIIQEEPMNKKESYPGTSANDASEVTIRSHPDTTNLPGSRYSPGRQHCSNTWVPSFPGVDQDKVPRNIKDSMEKDDVNPVNIRRYHPTTMLPRNDRTNDVSDNNLENKTLGSGCDTSVNTCQDPYLSRDLVDVHGRLDPLELRLKGDYAGLQTTTYTNSKFVYEEEMYERGLMMNEMSSDGERARDRIGAIRSRDSSFQSRTVSLQYTGRTRSYEKPDYSQTGEDLTCGESCCRWRIPKRHVANRVTASPWRQIVRPHHSPKLQPIVLQTHTDDTEVVESVHVPETSRPTTSLNSPTRQSPKNTATTDGFYGFEVPTTCELSFNNNIRPLESTLPESRVQPFYTPPIPYTTSPQTTLPIPGPTNQIRNNETFFHSTTSNRTVLASNENVPLISSNKKDGYFPQVLPQTPTKPELSHPISRLCDTIESNEKSDNFINLEAKKLDDEVKGEEKVTGSIFVNSDSNNNDSIVSNDVSQRGKSTGHDDHRCDECGKTFVTRASLKVHTRTHSGEKPFRCADCGKQFSQLRNYKYHRSVHEGTREFAATCPECGKYFNDRGYLSSHMKIHRNRKEYGCAECGKSFNQRVAYNMHVRIHTGVKPHQCEQCGKAFSRKMLLKQHLRTHSGERPYQCQVCQKAFADRSNMTLHTRLHSGLKPYQCTLCSKAFTKKHHLKTHLNYHTGTKPYSCPNCGLRFSQSSNMRTHYKKCTVNNPGGVKSAQNGGDNVESTKIVEVQVISRTATDALTPPNSDQESSILTPISKTAGGKVNLT